MVENDSSRLTPEKQLLKLIEDPNTENLLKAKGSYRAKSFFSFDFFKGGFNLLKKKNIGEARTGILLAVDINGINWFLKICVLAAAAYFVFDMMVSVKKARIVPDFFVGGKASAGFSDILEVKPNLKPLSNYHDKVDARDVFSPYVEPEPEEEKPEEKDLKKKAAPPKEPDYMQALVLVGISWSNNPDVIIQNTQLNRTFFVKTGDKIGEITVKKILKDRVILERNGEESELK